MRPQRWALSRSTWVMAAGLTTFGIVMLLSGRDLGAQFERFEQIVTHAGLGGALLFIGLYVVATSAFFPGSILAVAAGATFGMGHGVAIVVLGALIGASLQYWLARTFLHEPIARWITKRPMFEALTHVLHGRPLRIQLLLRLTPISPAVVSYLLGSAATEFRTFLIACVGLTPHVLLEVYVGHVGRHLASVPRQGAHGMRHEDIVVVLGLVVALAGMTWVAHIARKAVLAAIPSTPIA